MASDTCLMMAPTTNPSMPASCQSFPAGCTASRGQTSSNVCRLGDANEGRCDLAIGRDGTVSRSAEALDAGVGQPRECALRFWPAALGPTEP